MILLILTGILFVALVALAAMKMQKKVMALGVCVILLVLCNFANEIAAASQHDAPRQQVKREQQVVQHLTPAAIIVLTNETIEEKAGELLEEERQMVGYLVKRWEGREYTLVHFDNLHRSRLRIIMEVLSYRINHADPHRNIQPYHLDFKHQDCDIRCLKKTIQQLKQDAFMVLIIENAKNAEELSNLQAVYQNQHITIIFQNIPKFFSLHTISRLTYRFPFSNNYLPKLLQQHPSKTIQFCSLYRSFDYNFYSASLTTPLLDLCSRPLPTTAAVKCVKKHITEQKMRVPESWVRKCLSEQGQEGLIIQNGWVGLKKEYFWSGRVNKTDLVPEREDL